MKKMEHVKTNYLAMYQMLYFSKTFKSDAALADVERRRLFVKYSISNTNVSAEAGAFLFQDELKNYTNVVDSQKSLNNYWRQFNFLNVATSNNPLEWKSNLNDLNLALEHVEPLSCNEKSTIPCHNEQLCERDIEKLMNWWKNGSVSPRARKVSRQEQKLFQNRIHVDQLIEDKYRPSDFELTAIEPSRAQVETINNTKLYSNPVRQIPNNERQVSNFEKQYFNSGKMSTIKRNSTMQTKQNTLEKHEERQPDEKFAGFKTARKLLSVQLANKNNKQTFNRQQHANNRQPVKKSLGGKALNAAFVCPFKDNQSEENEVSKPTDERLKSIEPKMIELIRNEIMDCGNPIAWDDIAGLEHAKRIIKEIVVFPMLRPDIFTGLRRPPKGILLFGPPGTGKTLIGKCIASQSKSTFFSISASSLTSKWVGEGEKMVRALFAVAQVEQPSVVFIDEIDSLLCQRSETEHESSRRMKTEFLVQLDGASTGDEDRILVIGATNRPHELDEAARRRFVKRLYIPLPELEAREQIVRNLLKTERHDLSDDNIYQVAKFANGYSGADMTNLCKEASMGPIRSIPFDQLEEISKEDVREVTIHDFREALNTVRPSVSQKDLSVYVDWDHTYGTASAQS